MSELKEKVRAYMKAHRMVTAGDTVLVGFSGGYLLLTARLPGGVDESRIDAYIETTLSRFKELGGGA